jgi:light-regulated signal transduction histidine kinase (bacteriophytochrome)
MPLDHPFRPALMRIQHVTTLAELVDVVVREMRRVTGYDRVLFYRFHEDAHGSVDAEAKEATLDPYLGLHYPASDIPAQARQLYLKSWLRVIADARATPARVVPALRPDTGAPLDLSFAVLRSVSPVHLEYMANMGVRASMSVSLIVRDRLWGLISCLDHTGPRRVRHDMRAACEFLGRLASLHIAAFEDRALLAMRAARRGTEEALAESMRAVSGTDHALTGLLARPQELMDLVSAEGVALVGAGETATRGKTPPPALIQEIAAWLDGQSGGRELFSTASLGTLFPPAQPASAVASGLLTFTLPGAPPKRLLWFRPEIISTVNWGGDPTKAVAAGSRQRLRPRHSFALWRQEVRLHARPWTVSDLEAAEELRRRAVEVDLERRLVSEQRAVQARDELIAVVSHDLRTPLSTITMLSEVMMSHQPSADAPSSHLLRDGPAMIRSSARHMKALIDDLLDLAKIEANRFALQRRSTESGVLIDESLRAASPLAVAKKITIASHADSAVLEVDPEKIHRVLSNLLGNAIKFTPEGGTITVRAERHDGELIVAVSDTGPGIPADELPHLFERYWQARPARHLGTGLGLYIAKGIVEAHGGRIWAESPAGARLIFALPLAR